MVFLLAVGLVATILPFLGNAGDPSPAGAQDWTHQKPKTGHWCVGPEGRDGKCGDEDDPNDPLTWDNWDGIHNRPGRDLRGDDRCDTKRDNELFCVYGTGELGGQHGCFTNNEANCVGEAGDKSAEWDIEGHYRDHGCLVDITVTNTSSPRAAPPKDQPYRGCIYKWSSPGALELQKAMREKILEPTLRTPPEKKGIPPGVSVTATEGPGSDNGRRKCILVTTRYTIGFNPDSDPEPIDVPAVAGGGIAEAIGDSPDASIASADSSGSAAPPYAAIAGAAAAALAIAAGGWYARRRLS